MFIILVQLSSKLIEGCNNFDSLMEFKINWEELCHHQASKDPTALLAKLLLLRPAFNINEASHHYQEDINNINEVRDLLVEKINRA